MLKNILLNTNKKTTILIVFLVVFCFILVLGIDRALAIWIDATSLDQNIEEPINTSDEDQSKYGPLILNNQLTVDGIIYGMDQSNFSETDVCELMTVGFDHKRVCLNPTPPAACNCDDCYYDPDIEDCTNAIIEEIDPIFHAWYNNAYPYLYGLYINSSDVITPTEINNVVDYIKNNKMGIYVQSEKSAGYFKQIDDKNDVYLAHKIDESELNLAGGSLFQNYHPIDDEFYIGVKSTSILNDGDDTVAIPAVFMGSVSETDESGIGGYFYSAEGIGLRALGKIENKLPVGKAAEFYGQVGHLGKVEHYGDLRVRRSLYSGSIPYYLEGDVHLSGDVYLNQNHVVGNDNLGTIIWNYLETFNNVYFREGVIAYKDLEHDGATYLDGELRIDNRAYTYGQVKAGGNSKGITAENVIITNNDIPTGWRINNSISASRFEGSSLNVEHSARVGNVGPGQPTSVFTNDSSAGGAGWLVHDTNVIGEFGLNSAGAIIIIDSDNYRWCMYVNPLVSGEMLGTGCYNTSSGLCNPMPCTSQPIPPESSDPFHYVEPNYE